jgi:hypothetical protein
MNDWAELICARCGKLLTPGSGDFWEVRIEAVADPHPPHFTEEDLQRDTHRDWNALIESLRDLSPREAMDQVYRHTVLQLCQACFTRWYERPVD